MHLLNFTHLLFPSPSLSFGDFYGYDGSIDTVYEREVAPRLPSGTNRYMDWTAAALYLNSQIEDSMNDFKTHLYGNPHSAHTSSTLTTARIEKLREELLLFFGADPTEYTVRPPDPHLHHVIS